MSDYPHPKELGVKSGKTTSSLLLCFTYGISIGIQMVFGEYNQAGLGF